MVWRRALSCVLAVISTMHTLVALAAEESPRFNVVEFNIVGNTLLRNVDVEQTVYPFLGADKTLQDIETARVALEQRYRDAGYPAVMVNIPEQEVNAGVVRLDVVEGRIDQLRITGSRYYTLSALRARVPALKEGVPLHTPALQQQVNALNSVSADRSVLPVPRRGRLYGTVDVDLKVTDELPLHGSVELTDRYTHDTSKLRAGASISYDNLWQRAHSLGLSVQVAPEEPDESRVFSANYLWRFEDSPAVLALYAVRTESDTSTIGDQNVIGNGNIYGARAVLPLGGGERTSHSMSIGVDYKDFKESVVLAGSDTRNTPISYYVAVAEYSSTTRGDATSVRSGISAISGLRGADTDRIDCFGQRVDEFECKRYGARANFFYLRGDVQLTHTLPRDFRLVTALDAQVANEPLISNEQFSAGGATSVRGYAESQAAGDSGVRASVELHSPAWGKAWLQEMRALLFVDGAALRVIDAQPGEEHTPELASTGFGVRARAFDGMSLELDGARVFHAANHVDSGDMRAHFRIAYEF